MGVQLTKEERKDALASVRRYLEEGLEVEACDLKAGLLLDYVLKEIGPFAYNSGVRDADRYFREKMEDLGGACYEHPLTYWTEGSRRRPMGYGGQARERGN